MCTLRIYHHVGQRHEITRLKRIFYIHVLFKRTQDPILIPSIMLSLNDSFLYHVIVILRVSSRRFSSIQLCQLIFVYPPIYP